MPIVIIFPFLSVCICVESGWSWGVSYLGYSSANSNTTSSLEDDEDYEDADDFRFLTLSSGPTPVAYYLLSPFPSYFYY